MSADFTVRMANSEAEREAIYALRWRVLREPWGYPPGSERDELDEAVETLHAYVAEDSQPKEPLAVARGHFVDPHRAQIRYMAVDPSQQGQGLGRLVLEGLEAALWRGSAEEIFLHARQPVARFYTRMGYRSDAFMGDLFAGIPHWLMSKRRGEKVAQAGNWLQLHETERPDVEGKIRRWEWVRRTGMGGAVAVVAMVPGEEPSLLLTRQWRPPLAAWAIEFPAGLVDDGESPEETALRELHEETGAGGSIRQVGLRIYSSPGLTDEWVQLVEVEVTSRGTPQPEATEQIEVLEVPLHELNGFLRQRDEAGDRIDAKLWSWVAGLQSGRAETFGFDP